ncbi:MAG: VOC family protein [Pseudomonadota bacterium]
MGAPRFHGLSPLIMVSDVDRSVTFYTDVLGFEKVIRNDDHNYAMLRREGAWLALIQNTSDEARKVTSENTAAQIWVSEIDALWEEIEPLIKDMPDIRAKAPHDRDYGVREIHLTDPDGFLMFLTQDPTLKTD